MARFLAAFLLLVLLAESAPMVPLQAGGCSMPCCKRSGGKIACCPRPAAALQQQRAEGDGCRMVACDAPAREATSIRLHLQAILDAGITLAHPPLPGQSWSPLAYRPMKLAEDPPTPPPRYLQA